MINIIKSKENDQRVHDIIEATKEVFGLSRFAFFKKFCAIVENMKNSLTTTMPLG